MQSTWTKHFESQFYGTYGQTQAQEGPSLRASAATSMSSMPLPTVRDLVSQFPETPPSQPGHRTIEIPKAMENVGTTVLPDTSSVTSSDSSHRGQYSWDGTGTPDSQIFLQRSETPDTQGISEFSMSEYSRSGLSHFPEEEVPPLPASELLLHRRLQRVPPPIRTNPNNERSVFDGQITVISAGASTAPNSGNKYLQPIQDNNPSFFNMTPLSSASGPGVRGSKVSGVPVSPTITSAYPSWYGGSQSGAESIQEQDTALGRIASRWDRLPTAYASYFIMGGGSPVSGPTSALPATVTPGPPRRQSALREELQIQTNAQQQQQPRPHPFAAAGARQSGYMYTHAREPSLALLPEDRLGGYDYDYENDGRNRDSLGDLDPGRDSQTFSAFPRGVSMIKNIGRVANHRTPTPNTSTFDRRSLATEYDTTPGSGTYPYIRPF